MTCREIEILLPEYAARRLDEAGRKRVERHLEACAKCRLELSEIEKLFDFAAARFPGREEVPEGYFDTVWPRLYSRIQAEKLNEPEVSIFKRLWESLPVPRPGAFQLVNLVLIMLVGFSLYLSYRSDRGTPAVTRQQPAIEAVKPDTSRNEPVYKEEKALADLGPSDSTRERLKELGQYLNPRKQREMYESLTDYIAEVVVLLD
ncbi:MAG TPA: zf-HC2 domain-containing protein [archaeon]|nr:zf-HC2 domain-containing protein [archaeon]